MPVDRYWIWTLAPGLVSLTPCWKPHGELLDQGDVHPADEADLAVLGLQRGSDTGKVGALLLGEDDRGDVRLLGDGVHEAESGLRVLGRGLVDRVLVGEADTDDGIEAALGEGRETLLAVGRGLTGLGGELLGLDTEVRLGLVQATRGGVVEGVVAATADVVGHADLDFAVAGAGALGGRLTAGGGGESECRSRDGRGEDLGYPAQEEGPFETDRKRLFRRWFRGDRNARRCQLKARSSVVIGSSRTGQ